jgi:hypothetical protein
LRRVFLRFAASQENVTKVYPFEATLYAWVRLSDRSIVALIAIDDFACSARPAERRAISRDPVIVRKNFHTYEFADHKQEVINLLGRVTRVSIATAAILEEMAKAGTGP